jgi:hypothetical protein
MRRATPGLRYVSITLVLMACGAPSFATQLTVIDPAGQPLATDGARTPSRRASSTRQTTATRRPEWRAP